MIPVSKIIGSPFQTANELISNLKYTMLSQIDFDTFITLLNSLKKQGIILDVTQVPYNGQLYDPILIEEEDEYRLYTSDARLGLAGGLQCIILSTCPKQLIPTKWEYKQVVLAPTPNTIYSSFIRNGSVIKKNNEYLLYAGCYDGNIRRIGIFKSADGINFEYVGKVDPSGEEAQLMDPAVVYWKGKYYMYYSVFFDIYGNQLKSVKIAVSDDGVNWTKLDEAAIKTSKTGWDDTFIEWHHATPLKDRLVMCYEGYDGSLWRLGIAYSFDGVHWTKYSGNPVWEGHNDGDFDETNVATGAFYFLNGVLLLIYQGQSTIPPYYWNRTWRLGLACSSIFNTDVAEKDRKRAALASGIRLLPFELFKQPRILIRTSSMNNLLNSCDKVEAVAGNITADSKEMTIVGGSATSAGTSFAYMYLPSPTTKCYVKCYMNNVQGVQYQDASIDLFGGDDPTVSPGASGDTRYSATLRVQSLTTKGYILAKCVNGNGAPISEFGSVDADTYYKIEVYADVEHGILHVWANDMLVLDARDDSINQITAVRFRTYDPSTTEALSTKIKGEVVVAYE